MRYLIACFILIFLFTVLPPAAAQQPPPPAFEPAPCPFNFATSLKIICGYVAVPEDHTQPTARQIKLGVAVVKSTSANPAPDPFVYVTGGPGGDVIFGLQYMVPQFENVLLTRDVLFIDQRGTGWSQPALDCPELKTLLASAAEGQVVTPNDKHALYLLCRDRFIAQGINLTHYTTNATAADLPLVWQALGYKQVNLYGISYGTIAAETIMRDHPQGVRTVTLDSFYPLQISVFADSAQNYARLMRVIFNNCAADFLCRLFYPDVEKFFYEQIERLKHQPVMLTGIHPFTKQSFTFTFDSYDFLQLIASAPARTVPAIIYNIRDSDYGAVIEDRQQSIKNYAEKVRRGSPADNMGARHSVLCSQNAYYATPAQLAALNAYPEAAWAIPFIEDMSLRCREWPAAPRNPAELKPLPSDIPTLLFAGEYDSSVAPAYAEMMQRDLKTSYAYVVRDAGHGVLAANGLCAQTIMLSFINNPHQPPTEACLNQTPWRLDTTFMLRGAFALPVASGLIILFSGVLLTSVPSFSRALPRRLFTVRQSLLSVNFVLLGLGTFASVIALAQGDQNFLLLPVARVLEVILPLVMLIQGAFLLSPEDEPLFEVMLTMRRSLSWTLLERFALVVAVHLTLGLALSAYAASRTGETFLLTFSRWFAPLLFFGALSALLTIFTQRAPLSVVLTILLWAILFFVGDYLVKIYPLTWLVNPYLPPLNVFYVFNRWLFVLASGVLLFAATKLLRNEENLLLGSPRQASTVGRPSFNLPLFNFQTPLLAIARYEFLMHVRRPTLGILVVVLLITPLLGVFFAQSSLGGVASSVAAGGLTLDQARSLVTSNMMLTSWLFGWALMSSLLFVLVADTIPRDQHLGVRELLNALPLRVSTYLWGKVLGVWLVLGVGVLLAMTVSGTAWWFGVYQFHVDTFLQVWLVGILPLALINSALSVLLIATQPNTRRAILAGVGLLVLVQISVALGFFTLDNFWTHLVPARPSLLLYFLFGYPHAEAGSGSLAVVTATLARYTSFTKAWLDLAGGALEVLLVYVFVWWRLKRDH